MKVDVSCMDREEAVLIYNEKIYIHDNHQMALYDALIDNNEDFFKYVDLTDNKKDIYDIINDNIDTLANLTNDRSAKNEIFTFDIYDNEYLIAHYKSNLYLNIDKIRSYAEKKNLIIGYFENMNDDNCIIIN